MNDVDREQVKQIAKEAFWELVDNEVLPLLKDFIGARLTVVESKKEPQGKPQKEPSAAVPESTFTGLKYEDGKGEKLGEFQVAYRAQNSPDAWQHCFNILKANNASIKDSLHLEGYVYRYWIYLEHGYENRIFRKQLEADK